MNNQPSLSNPQQVTLILLRTLIGWHFLYEGYYKYALPGWGADGTRLGAWSSAGYLKSATGPLAALFQRMAEAGWLVWIDRGVKISLVLIGLSLMLGLLTRLGGWGALLLLSLFYLLMVPLNGMHQPGSEGAYLIVNKTLIEAAAVAALLTFRTETIAGLDLWLANRRNRRATALRTETAN